MGPTTKIDNPNSSSALQIIWYYTATEHQVYKQVLIKIRPEFHLLQNAKWIHFQYIIYDWESMVADVGGFLGLLIGQSIYGIYDGMINWLRLKNWSNKSYEDEDILMASIEKLNNMLLLYEGK